MRNRGLFSKVGNVVNIPELNYIQQRCLRCGRKLKNPNSQRIGYGPSCDKKRLDGGKIYRGRRLF